MPHKLPCLLGDLQRIQICRGVDGIPARFFSLCICGRFAFSADSQQFHQMLQGHKPAARQTELKGLPVHFPVEVRRVAHHGVDGEILRLEDQRALRDCVGGFVRRFVRSLCAICVFMHIFCIYIRIISVFFSIFKIFFGCAGQRHGCGPHHARRGSRLLRRPVGNDLRVAFPVDVQNGQVLQPLQRAAGKHHLDRLFRLDLLPLVEEADVHRQHLVDLSVHEAGCRTAHSLRIRLRQRHLRVLREGALLRVHAHGQACRLALKALRRHS